MCPWRAFCDVMVSCESFPTGLDESEQRLSLVVRRLRIQHLFENVGCFQIERPFKDRYVDGLDLNAFHVIEKTVPQSAYSPLSCEAFQAVIVASAGEKLS